MGTYIYSVRAKHVVVDGKNIHALQYLTKPDYGSLDRQTAMLCGKAEAFWERKFLKGESPWLVYQASTDGKATDGDMVFDWDGSAWDYDTPDFKAILARRGWLFKFNGKWTIKREYFQVQLGEMRPLFHGPSKCFHVEMTSPAFYSQEQLDVWLENYGAKWPNKNITHSVIDESQTYGVRHVESAA